MKLIISTILVLQIDDFKYFSMKTEADGVWECKKNPNIYKIQNAII